MKKMSTSAIVFIGMMTAISVVLSFVLKIPMLAPWLKLDFSFVPMLLTGFALGPVAGLCVLLLTNLIHLFASNSGMVGQLADVLMGTCYLLPAVLIYKVHHTRKGAMIGMGVGTLCLIVGGIIANLYLLLPLYLGSGWAEKLGNFGFSSPGNLIAAAVLPFNLIKGLAVALITAILYKRLSRLLRAAEQKEKNRK